MQRIHIKPDVVMNSSKLLPTSSVANIQDDLTRVRARLDHRIRSRHNIDGRLSNVIREIDDIERKMRKIKNFTEQSMERYTQVERDLANRSSRFNRLQSPNLMKRGNWWESYFSSDRKTRNRLINLLFPWLQMTFQRHFGLLFPIGPALSFNKWINPNSPREVVFSDVEKQAIVDYLKRVENGEVSSNMDQYASMTNSYEGYIGENNIFGQPLGGNAPKTKNVETVSAILDFLPFIGNLKAASEAYLGYDPLTGRKLENWERGVAAAAILGGGAARIGGKVAPKVVDKVGDLGKGIDKGKGVIETNLRNIDDFIKGNKKFDEVIEDYAKVYKEHVELNKPWSWDDTIPGGDSLSSAQKRKIKEMAIEKGHIPEIKVTKADGMRYGFADFASAGVVEETVQLPRGFWRLTDKEQFKWLDDQIGGTRKGMTWHHTEVPGKMELVPFGIHNITPHNGGRTKGMWADAPR